MEATILTKCLELTKLLKDQNRCFDITIKLESSNIRMTSEEKKSMNKVKKSPSQLNRDKCRKQRFIDSKSEAEVPSTDIKSDTQEPKQKDEKDLVDEVKKGLKVTDTELEVTKFLDNLLKPKVPVANKKTREVKGTFKKGNLKWKCIYDCEFVGESEELMHTHLFRQHWSPSVSPGDKYTPWRRGKPPLMSASSRAI